MAGKLYLISNPITRQYCLVRKDKFIKASTCTLYQTIRAIMTSVSGTEENLSFFSTRPGYTVSYPWRVKVQSHLNQKAPKHRRASRAVPHRESQLRPEQRHHSRHLLVNPPAHPNPNLPLSRIRLRSRRASLSTASWISPALYWD
jgi:hypothetical protein